MKNPKAKDKIAVVQYVPSQKPARGEPTHWWNNLRLGEVGRAQILGYGVADPACEGCRLAVLANPGYRSASDSRRADGQIE